MALPPLASVADLANLLHTPLTAPADDARAASLLVASSSLVRAESGSPWVDSNGDLVWDETTDSRLLLVQEVLTSVALAAAARAWNNPDGGTSRTETLGPYTETVRYSEDAAGVYLTDDEQRAIARAVAAYRGSGSPGLWTLATTREDVETDTVFLATTYASNPLLDAEPIPYRTIGDPT